MYMINPLGNSRSANDTFFQEISFFHVRAEINECTTDVDDCHAQAICSNSVGSFSCTCHTGYTGNGKHCSGALIVTVVKICGS